MDTKERGEWEVWDANRLMCLLSMKRVGDRIVGRYDESSVDADVLEEAAQKIGAMLAATPSAPEPAGVVVTDAMVERANDVWRYYVTSKNLDPWNNSRLLMNVVLRAALRQPTEGEK